MERHLWLLLLLLLLLLLIAHNAISLAKQQPKLRSIVDA